MLKIRKSKSGITRNSDTSRTMQKGLKIEVRLPLEQALQHEGGACKEKAFK
jgi:hypothetical protein